MRKQIWIALLALLVPGILSANTIYTYTGNHFTDFVVGDPNHFNFDTSDFVTYKLTLATPLAANLTNFQLRGSTGLLAYSANNGFCTLSEVGVIGPPPLFPPIPMFGKYDFTFLVSTDGAGNISGWNLVAVDSSPLDTPTCAVTTRSSPPLRTDTGSVQYTHVKTESNVGSVSNNPGNWTVTDTPEPLSLILLPIGLIGVIWKKVGQKI